MPTYSMGRVSDPTAVCEDTPVEPEPLFALTPFISTISIRSMLALPGQLSADLVLFFVVGLLGGAHCIGMCGPLVTVYSGKMSDRNDRLTTFEVRQHALFNLGRTGSYAFIGGLFGALGGVVYVTADTVTETADLFRGSMGAIVGLFVIAVGIYYLLGRTSVGGHLPGLGASRLLAPLMSRIDRLAAGPGIVGLGAVHGLLPCPILYPAFLYAFATGSPTAGALLLAALGIGTFPAVFLYGTIIDAVDPTSRRRLHRVLGAAFIVLGYVLFAHGLMSLGIMLPHPSLPHYQPLEVATHAIP